MAIALRVSRNEEEAGLKLIYSENIRLALARAGDGQITPQSAKEAAANVRRKAPARGRSAQPVS